MEQHLFRVQVHRTVTTSLFIPEDSDYVVWTHDSSQSLKPSAVNDGSFALDAPNPIVLNYSVKDIHVNFPLPIDIKKIFVQSATGKNWFHNIQYSFTQRSEPLLNEGSLFSAVDLLQTNRNHTSGQYSYEADSNGITTINVDNKSVEAMHFNVAPAGVPDIETSIRFGFEVTDASRCKLVFNNGISRSFYRNDFTTIVPSWSDNLKFQLVSSPYVGSDTNVTVKKVA